MKIKIYIKMKIFLSLLFICLSLFANIRCVEEEDKVLVLDDNNFDEELKKHKSILVEFYAPWCGHCKTLAPEYAKAAEILRGLESPFYLAKIDATVSSELSQRFSIEGFPTLKFFRDGVWKDYDGGRTAEEIVQWVKKKLLPPSTELKSIEEIEKIKNDNVVTVIYFGDINSDHFKTFMKVANKYEDVIFGHTINPEFFEKYELKSSGGIILFKKFDEGKNVFDQILLEDYLTDFINTYSVPLITKFDDRAADAIFGREKAAIFYIRSESKPKQDEVFTKLAKDYRGKIIFVATDHTSEIEEKLMEYYGLKEADLPHVRITDVKGDSDIFNYVLSGEITEESVSKFIQDFLDGNLKPYIKSEPVPTEQKEAAYQLVGSTFNELVIDSPKNVLVEFYAPWCGHCKSLAPIYEKIAEHYKNDTSILIAKIDHTANDIPDVTVEGYPTIKYFPVGEKSNPVEFAAERDFDSILEFVEKLAHPEKFVKEVKVKADDKDDKDDHDHHDHHDHDHDHDDHNDHDHNDHEGSEITKSEL
jgi:protein disulfide-isomerase A1